MTLDQDFREAMIGGLARIEEQLKRLNELVGDHQETLYGPVGLKPRVEIIDNDINRWKLNIRLVYGAVVGLIAWTLKKELF